jgi:large subunit ribosomal protein L18
MSKKSYKTKLLERRKMRVRRKIEGTADYPRLSVRRSLKHIYAQVIDDATGRTLASASSLALKIPGGNVASAKEVGKNLAEAALKNNVKSVRFDRNGRLYHGRLKALADAAREAGLKI